jgi:serpin B
MKRTLVITALGVAAALGGTALAPGQQGKAGPDARAVAKGNTEFALDLYGKLRQKDGNLFLSPYSVSTALAMTYAGARGQTAEEMARTLHFNLGREELDRGFAALLGDINRSRAKERGYELSVANALWGQKDFGFLPGYLDLTHKYYGAGLREVDFAGATEQARRTINGWVERQTHDKIKDLLPQGILTGDTRLVLTNAIYFKGFWAHQFKKQNTRDEPFTTSAGKPVKTPLMHRTGSYGYLDAGDFQALELAYRGDDLAMVVLLPKKADGLGALEEKLTEANLAAWLGRLGKREVQVALPRFKMTREFNLNTTLQALGMRRAFVPGGADFTGMAGSVGRKLFIQAVVHKAFVDVNEEGTEAAAATGVAVALTAARVTPTFRADHPFVFLIRDKRSGSVLFMGRLTNPQG